MRGIYQMKTRAEKRKEEKGQNYFFEFQKIQQNFFKDLPKKLQRVKDGRHKSYIQYPPEVILYMLVLKNATGCQSMRNMTERFNKDECIENVGKALGIEKLEELPHYDTINDFLSVLEPSSLEKIQIYMIQELLKKRCLEKHRVNGKYWPIIFDGTGLFSFSEKHCEHCLRREVTDKKTEEKRTIYMHHVLEAKLVIGNMVLSIGTEFIENESEDVTKQDCEIKAFYRLAKKLKKNFSRLPICVLGDSLYACEPVFKICDEFGWKYMMHFKEGRIRSVAAEFEAIKSLEKSEVARIKKETENKKESIIWVNDISYNERRVNLLEIHEEIEVDDNEKDRVLHFVYMTNFPINQKNVESLCGLGRSRWKIENEGFNLQKNHQLFIEHLNSHNYNAMKNHYLIAQISHVIIQLFENGSKIVRESKKSIKEKSSYLLEALRTLTLTEEDTIALAKPTQVRFIT